MKPNETIFGKNKKEYAVMLLCFLYAGFALLSLSLTLYSTYRIPFRADRADFNVLKIEKSTPTPRDLNWGRFNHYPQRLKREFSDPIAFLTSPLVIIYSASGFLSLFAGITIWSLIRKKEFKHIKQQTADNLLLPDEKKVINALKQSNFELTQSKLVKVTGMSKVQVHRAVKRLEQKGVLEKHSFGLTNKIILKKEFFE